jgi:broad specificity phosphatase PhoE
MTTTMSLRLYLIRHGQTAWSLSGQHTGRTDIPLTARGEDEAKGLALRLQAIPFAHVLTSPRQRARRTCELVGLGPAAEIEPDLAEWDYGDYEGVRSVDIRKMRADWNLFRDGCPNGETPAHVSARADRLIARLRQLDGNVALFSHGQFGSVLAARWIGLPPIEAQHFALGTASLSILGCDPHHPKVPVIALWNEASHELVTGARPRAADKQTMKQQAIERWENEGGEIPNTGADA